MFTAEQAAAGGFFVHFEKKASLFCKGMCWGPQARFTAEHAFSSEMRMLVKLLKIFVNILWSSVFDNIGP